ncbi:integrase catalytic domain-containing protein [Trichonephila inaurata madagascariensis]|uniref:Integrase catalytic domain-containing protein n=1 Tax=Trichonephila inaurata madagascariensis TaxID=2747483 RepID=A0A8X7C908_9ARAC|nr:integrase catalytic domain-containing protein [Trichonephila inaurata madagascariensis]
MTTAYHPQTNGLAESFTKTLAAMLAMYVDVEQKTWDRILPFVTFASNTARQYTTGFTPFFLTFGREAETTLGMPCSKRAHRIYNTRLRSPISDPGGRIPSVGSDLHPCSTRERPTSLQFKTSCPAVPAGMKPHYDPDLQARFNDSVASDDRRLEKVHHPLEGTTIPDQVPKTRLARTSEDAVLLRREH